MVSCVQEVDLRPPIQWIRLNAIFPLDLPLLHIIHNKVKGSILLLLLCFLGRARRIIEERKASCSRRTVRRHDIGIHTVPVLDLHVHTQISLHTINWPSSDHPRRAGRNCSTAPAIFEMKTISACPTRYYLPRTKAVESRATGIRSEYVRKVKRIDQVFAHDVVGDDNVSGPFENAYYTFCKGGAIPLVIILTSISQTLNRFLL